MTKTTRRSTTSVEVARIYNLLAEHTEDIHVRHIRREGFGDLYRRGETTASLSTNKANFVALSNVLYQVISILSRDNLMSGEEETDLTEIVDSVVKSVRKG